MVDRISKMASTLLVVIVMVASIGMTVGEYLPVSKVFAASNVSDFEWIYYSNSMDGQGQRSHKLGKGTAQLKVNKCNNYTSSKKAKVILRKAIKKYPYYKNCGTVSFYKKGTYSFGSVKKDTYWLHITGGLSKCYKTASGKVQNK